MGETLQFTVPEMLSIIGAAQCVYIIVYMVMRAGRLSRAGLPILYFTVLTAAFLSDFGARFLGPGVDFYPQIQWALWAFGPPLGVLLIMQIAKITETPPLRHYWVLVLVPVAYGAARALFRPQDFTVGLSIMGMLAGGISLLTIWTHRGILDGLAREKGGKPRYWLILALIFTNVFLLFSTLAEVRGINGVSSAEVRTILGLAFVYLVGTSLFRIYPQAVRIDPASNSLSGVERGLAEKVEDLLTLEKIYHEPTYSRADMARECGVSEAVLSRVINVHFGKSFPQLLNERRIEDAKRLLRETDANVRVVAEEVGFNSLATFNRVFKDITGESPGRFRGEKAA